MRCYFEGQAWCSGESCLTESPGRGFEAASPQILRGKDLSRFIPSPNPTHVGAFGTGSAPLDKRIADMKLAKDFAMTME